MQYAPYTERTTVERTKVWATRGWSSQFTAVLVPDSWDVIPTMRDYLELLAFRLEWMIDERIKEVQAALQNGEMVFEEFEGVEESEALLTASKEVVFREIRAIASFPTMGNLSLDANLMQWTGVMIRDFSDLREALGFLGARENPPRDLFKFPLSPLETEDAEAVRGLILETTLEEWLTLMRAIMTNPD